MDDQAQWLRDQPVGSVIFAKDGYWRKGRLDTWHPVNTIGERLGRDNTIRSGYIPQLLGKVSTNAETDRIQHIRRR